jgi:hypothetical protein
MPIGPVTAALLGGAAAGHSTGSITPAGPLTLDVVAGFGGAVRTDQIPPAGADNVPYRTGCSGTIHGHEDLTPYNAAYVLRVNGTPFDCADQATSEANGRQIAYGPYPLAGLQVTRRVFVPAAGGFARFLERFSNPGTTAIEVDVKIESTWSALANLFVAPDQTGRTYAVTEDGTHGASGRETAGHVFAGAGGITPPWAVDFQPMVGPSSYNYRITVPAGATVTLMHFTVQRQGSDAAGAQTQASALANLTDPHAVAEMTAEEKARVVNFRIP